MLLVKLANKILFRFFVGLFMYTKLGRSVEFTTGGGGGGGVSRQLL